MATQKRTGGVEKIGLPLADEHSVRKVIRSLAGIFDLDLVSRMFKDESILPAKIVGGIPESGSFVPMSEHTSQGFVSAENFAAAHNVKIDFDFSSFSPVVIPAEARILSFSVTLIPATTGHVGATVQSGPQTANRVEIFRGYATAGNTVSGSIVAPVYPAETIGITPFWADPGDVETVEVNVLGYWT